MGKYHFEAFIKFVFYTARGFLGRPARVLNKSCVRRPTILGKISQLRPSIPPDRLSIHHVTCIHTHTHTDARGSGLLTQSLNLDLFSQTKLALHITKVPVFPQSLYCSPPPLFFIVIDKKPPINPLILTGPVISPYVVIASFISLLLSPSHPSPKHPELVKKNSPKVACIHVCTQQPQKGHLTNAPLSPGHLRHFPFS